MYIRPDVPKHKKLYKDKVTSFESIVSAKIPVVNFGVMHFEVVSI